jgi:hypothetical protein
MKYLLLTTASAVLTLLAPFTFAAELPAPAAIAAEHSVSTGSSVLMAQDDHGTDQRTTKYARSEDRGQFQLAADSDGRQDDRVPGTAA